MYEDIIHLIITLLLILAAFLFGIYISKRKRSRWLSWYILSLIVLVVVNLPDFVVSLAYVEPFDTLHYGYIRYAAIGFGITGLFSPLLRQIPEKRARALIVIMVWIFQLRYVLLPVASPMIYRSQVAQLQTRFQGNVCMQTTDYTCGPASAVTALYAIGIDASEADIGLAADTTPMLGTNERLLADAIEELYGVKCQCRYFKDIDTMKGQCPVMAVIEYSFWFDHFVTVLDVNDDFVFIGDPLNGPWKMKRADFARRWRKIGVVFIGGDL